MDQDLESLINEFKRFDISERESRIYLVLLKEGELAASDLHRLTGLPQPKIYSVLERMSMRGLCGCAWRAATATTRR